MQLSKHCGGAAHCFTAHGHLETFRRVLEPDDDRDVSSIHSCPVIESQVSLLVNTTTDSIPAWTYSSKETYNALSLGFANI